MEPLKVEIVHFYPANNAKAHNTTKYEEVNVENPKTTIVRRGQPFYGVIRFDRKMDEERDVVQFNLTIGNVPNLDNQAVMLLKKNVSHDKLQWTAKVTHVMENDDVMFELSTPVTTPVGSWKLHVVTWRRGDANTKTDYEFKEKLYILFNPWIVDDQTYMEDTKYLQEYVLNDVGKVWRGPVTNPSSQVWLFGQFDAVVLPACHYVLDKVALPFAARGDPVKVSRAISQIVNVQDDEGVLIGNWSGQYDDGTAPWEWADSVEILKQYLETGKPVRYGQCWVFAAVVTTVCRALGIPSRVVSNMVSAHDANSSLTVDFFYNEKMEDLELDPFNSDKSIRDSIWNYHVWNEVWMARPDLPKGYGGWQAIDATPQEQSAGLFQCGPASLAAIKEGMIGLQYDVEFLLSSVNADVMRWKEDPQADTGYSVVETNRYQVGQRILTKKPFENDPNGDKDVMDITSLYKYQEGSDAERIAFMTGVGQSQRAQRYYAVKKDEKSDVEFQLHDLETVPIGQDFRVAVTITNKSEEERTVKMAVKVSSVYYNGVRANMVKRTEGTNVLKPGQMKVVGMRVSAAEYLPHLVEYGNMKMSAVAIVEETKRAWADDDDFQVTKPTIKFKFEQDLIQNQASSIKVYFTNPLKMSLTNCQYKISSLGIAGRNTRVNVADVPADGVVAATVPVQPTKLGEIYFTASFTSKELKDVLGSAREIVLDA